MCCGTRSAMRLQPARSQLRRGRKTVGWLFPSPTAVPESRRKAFRGCSIPFIGWMTRGREGRAAWVWDWQSFGAAWKGATAASQRAIATLADRSEEHTSELQSRVDISYAVFCL